MERLRVLVVDDSLTIRAILSEVIGSEPGFVVVGLAADADEAGCMLETRVVDVVTLDIEMPGTNGIEFLKHFRTAHSTPVIMLSARTARGDEMRARALCAGADACFHKADAVRRKQELVDLIKSVAHHEAVLDSEDLAAKAIGPRD